MASKPFLYLLKKRVFSGYNKANKEIDWPIIPLQTMGKMRCEINERKGTTFWQSLKRNGDAD